MDISPQDNQEIRSLAIAKLKRAASLPRRQPAGAVRAGVALADPGVFQASPASSDGLASEQPRGHAEEYEETLTPARPMADTLYPGAGPSPYTPHDLAAHGHTPRADSTAAAASRSATPSPSSFRPLAPGRSTPSPLPSLGELRQLHRANSAAGRSAAMNKLMGGPGTPTTPTHGQIGPPPALHRAGSLSSSTMLATHSSPGSTRLRDAEPTPTFGINSPSKRRGPPRTAIGDRGVDAQLGRNTAVDASPDEAPPLARPRLERSYTVGNGGGEERRSVIGRRMMQRLGTRVADRLEALEVPCPVRTAAVRDPDFDTEAEGAKHAMLAADPPASPTITPVDATRMHSVLRDDSPTDPGVGALAASAATFARSPDTTPSRHAPSAYLGGMSLAPNAALPGDARAPSRISAMSGDDAFEYEAHLCRSASEKRRGTDAGAGKASRGSEDGPHAQPAGSADEESYDGHEALALGEPIAMTPRAPRPLTTDTQRYSDAPTAFEDAELRPPMATFASPVGHLSGHASAMSGSSGGSVSSLDPIARIPFIVPSVGDSPGQNARVRTARGVRERNNSGQKFPVEADESRGSSGYGTPKVERVGASTSPANTLPLQSVASSSSASLVSPASHQPSPVLVEPPVSASGSAFKEHFDDDTDDEGASPASLGVPLRKGSAASWEIVVKDEPLPAEAEKKQGSVAGRLKRSLSRSLSRKQSKSENAPVPTASLASSARSSHARASQGSSSGEHSSQNHSEERATPPSAFQDPTEPTRKGSLSSSILSRAPSVKLEPGQASPMPQVSPSDPRYNNAKLFPAPGIAPPPMLQQASDSAVPVLQQTRDGSQAQEALPTASASYHELSGQTAKPAPVVGQSIGKKSWLAEAFFAPTGARFHSKKPSVSSDRSFGGDEHVSPSRPALDSAPQRRLDSESTVTAEPTTDLSVGLAARHPLAKPVEPSRQTPFLSPNSSPLSTKSQAVLQRLDHILSLAPENEHRPDVLDDPPRRLVLCAPMLQVVNGHTVKDRFLFLFNDILVIAKPLSDAVSKSPLDGLFSVKSVVALANLTLMPATSDERPGSEAPQRHPVVRQFIETFARDPPAAIKLLYERSQLQGDTSTLASLLFKTPELDKEQLGQYLSGRANLPLLRAFIDRFKFQGVRLDEALRVFLLSIRLPAATVDVEAVLNTLAERWVAANQSLITFGKTLAAELVMAIMQLNDAINPGSGFGGFAFPNPAISMDDFVGAFRTKDAKVSVPTDLLEAIYAAVKRDGLAQSLPRSQAAGLREVISSRMPTRLTHNRWSEPTFVSIPRPDSRFGVKLHGEGLIFDPPHLEFTNSTEESFRVMGTSLGTRSLLFTRVGANAPLYANLPNAKTFVVERPFMRFTFQLAFVNHLDVKRKYRFSIDSAETRDTWCEALSRNISLSQSQRSGRDKNSSVMPGPVWCAAEDAALRTLQDAFIAEEKDSQADTSATLSPFGLGSGKPFSPPSSLRKPKIVRQITGRRISVAKIMMPLQKGEGDPAGDDDNMQGIDEEPTLPEKAQTGKDIVLVCRQNSILPLVLGLLHAGMDAVASEPNTTEFGLFDTDFNRETTPVI